MSREPVDGVVVVGCGVVRGGVRDHTGADMSGGFCHGHDRWLNEFGWCDECGEPVSETRPPLALANSVLDVTHGFSTDERGRIIPTRYVRACEGNVHVYASVPGECQCGQNHWDGKAVS
jgi:hypothetical protein